jgi:hypothetical protein
MGHVCGKTAMPRAGHHLRASAMAHLDDGCARRNTKRRRKLRYARTDSATEPLAVDQSRQSGLRELEGVADLVKGRGTMTSASQAKSVRRSSPPARRAV